MTGREEITTKATSPSSNDLKNDVLDTFKAKKTATESDTTKPLVDKEKEGTDAATGATQTADESASTTENGTKPGEKRKIGNSVKANIPAELEKICDELKEENHHLMKLIYDDIGLEELQVIVTQVWKIEKEGGMMTIDESRRRTPGGVFLHLMKDKLGKDKFNLMMKLNQKERKKLKAEEKGPHNGSKN